ncbi:MAG: UDP-3-O-(3-hydroxymyristoyl)glucosamine N-acyltransferase [Leptospiraceae bacterium]|nr:UDP-3-O-(3-hydroxymyristoyl)glucosamine N-acyltransferase [Leptospiraceae bacterium]MCP5495610.1 UDP-3-O-(3-hydroxymyristoyl)glucosamine N-acyltransferase [Leptospiraceae bacterium]
MHSLSDIHKAIPGSEIINCDKPEELMIQNLSTLYQELPNSLTYVSDKSYIKDAGKAKASAILIYKDWKDKFSLPAILVDNVDMALIEVLKLYYPERKSTGKWSKFVDIANTATIGENTEIGSFVCIGDNTKIGKNSIIENGVKIGKNVVVGDNAKIGPNTVIFDGVQIGNNFTVFANTSIGGDGFRFVDYKGINYKIPQVGTVIIGDDVEIGSNTSIDRGGIDDTIIGSGTKMDNDVQIAHNVKLGKNVIVAGATAIAGSTIVHDSCKISGACAIGDHIELPEGTMVAGGSGLRNSPPQKDVYAGWDWNLTFREFQKFRANIKHILNLNMIVKRLKDIEKKLGISDDS